MQRITHNLVQGSESWHQHRQSHFNASDAATMMGLGKYRTRAALLREKATGITEEVSDAQQRLFDRGHAAEAAIRPAIEKIIEEDLYPVTMSLNVDGLPLSASLDGQTLLGETLFECKLWNEQLAAKVRGGDLDPHYYWQLEQQLLVSGAERVIFATGDGGDRLETMEYRAVSGRVEALIAAWKQFAEDVGAYVPEATATPAATGRAPDALPALHIEVTGMVTASNLAEFKTHALTVLGTINRDLQTDDDFADAEQTVKWCKGVEERLEAAKAHALSQTASIDDLFRTIDSVSAEARRIRLDLDKLVTKEKESRRSEIVAGGVETVRQHYATINATLGEHALQVPSTLTSVIGISIKGKRTIASIRDAVDATVATAKIDASQVAERVRTNIAVLTEFSDHASLFADRVSLCAVKHPEDLRNLATSRVADYERREVDRLEAERERIRQEETEKMQRQQQEESDRLERELRAIPAPSAIEAPAATVVPTRTEPLPASISALAGTAPAKAAPPIKLGDINAWIAPLSISAEGLSQLGYRPVGSKGAAKLYAADDFSRICGTLAGLLAAAPARVTRHSEAA